jgi:glycosyltransferase involved in cell wall biosynthesis
MRIGVFIECLPETHAGGFQQVLSTIESLTRKNGMRHDFVVFTQFKRARQLLSMHGIEVVLFKHRCVRLIDRWSSTVLGFGVLRRLRQLGLRRLGRHLDALLDDFGVDLVLFTEIGESVLRIGDHPFIVTVWDLSHRDNPEFPEVYADRVSERRERVLRTTLPRALALIANSWPGAQRIASLYQVDSNRIIVLPFLPSVAVQRHASGNGSATVDGVRRKYDLPAQYVFYPAFFSPQKNHLYLLEGLRELERLYGIILHAVFCGGGNTADRATVEAQVEALGLIERVKFIGFVPDEDIPALYEGAVALVMPAYFGPTNLPPLEAVTLGCPVIYSDLPHFRTQMGDAALYCDLADVSSLADHLAALIQDAAVRDLVRKAGFKLAAEIAKIDYRERLAPIFDNFAYVSRRWVWPQKRR